MGFLRNSLFVFGPLPPFDPGEGKTRVDYVRRRSRPTLNAANRLSAGVRHTANAD